MHLPPQKTSSAVSFPSQVPPLPSPEAQQLPEVGQQHKATQTRKKRKQGRTKRRKKTKSKAALTDPSYARLLASRKLTQHLKELEANDMRSRVTAMQPETHPGHKGEQEQLLEVAELLRRLDVEVSSKVSVMHSAECPLCVRVTS